MNVEKEITLIGKKIDQCHMTWHSLLPLLDLVEGTYIPSANLKGKATLCRLPMPEKMEATKEVASIFSNRSEWVSFFTHIVPACPVPTWGRDDLLGRIVQQIGVRAWRALTHRALAEEGLADDLREALLDLADDLREV